MRQIKKNPYFEEFDSLSVETERIELSSNDDTGGPSTGVVRPRSGELIQCSRARHRIVICAPASLYKTGDWFKKPEPADPRITRKRTRELQLCCWQLLFVQRLCRCHQPANPRRIVIEASASPCGRELSIEDIKSGSPAEFQA